MKRCTICSKRAIIRIAMLGKWYCYACTLTEISKLLGEESHGS